MAGMAGSRWQVLLQSQHGKRIEMDKIWKHLQVYTPFFQTHQQYIDQEGWKTLFSLFFGFRVSSVHFECTYLGWRWRYIDSHLGYLPHWSFACTMNPWNKCLGRFLGIIGRHRSGSKQWSGRFLGMTSWDPSVCKSNRLHVHILRFSYIELGYIL